MRAVIVTFPAMGDATQVHVIVKNIGAVAERSFVWDLSAAR